MVVIGIQEVEQLGGHTSFESFENEYDEKILHADASLECVMHEVEFGLEIGSYELNDIVIYLFDGWYIALEKFNLSKEEWEKIVNHHD